MDRRSFNLNDEKNILFYDKALTADVLRRQESYNAQSERVAADSVAAWNWRRRLWNKTIAMHGPVL